MTFGARRHRLVIELPVDGTKIRMYIVNYLCSSGLRIKTERESDVELESNHGFSRIFKNWFGMETLSIKQSVNKIVVEGPVRHVDSVDSKLRFGKEFC